MKSLETEELRPAGFIVKPHGFKGEVLLGYEIGDISDFPQTDYLFLLVDGLPVPFRVMETKVRSGQLIARLEDVDSEAEARKLNGVEMMLPGRLIEEVADEVGFEDLEGYMVVDRILGKIGTIESIEEYPMQLLARFDYQGKEVMFPLNETIVVAIDSDAREIFTELPEGLLDVYTEESADEHDDEEA